MYKFYIDVFSDVPVDYIFHTKFVDVILSSAAALKVQLNRNAMKVIAEVGSFPPRYWFIFDTDVFTSRKSIQVIMSFDKSKLDAMLAATNGLMSEYTGFHPDDAIVNELGIHIYFRVTKDAAYIKRESDRLNALPIVPQLTIVK